MRNILSHALYFGCVCKIWNTLMDNQLDNSWYCTSREFGLGFLYLLQNNVLRQTDLAQLVLKCPNLPANRLVQVAAVEKHLWIHTFSFLEEDWILYCLWSGVCLFLPFLGECLEFLPLDESTGCAEIIYPWTKFCGTPPMLKTWTTIGKNLRLGLFCTLSAAHFIWTILTHVLIYVPS